MLLDLEIADGRVRQKDRRPALARALDFLLWHQHEKQGVHPLPVDWPIADEYEFFFAATDGRATFIAVWAWSGDGTARVFGVSNRGEPSTVLRTADLAVQPQGFYALHVSQDGPVPFRGTVSVLADGKPVTAGPVHLASFQPYYVWMPLWRSPEEDEGDDECEEYAA